MGVDGELSDLRTHAQLAVYSAIRELCEADGTTTAADVRALTEARGRTFKRQRLGKILQVLKGKDLIDLGNGESGGRRPIRLRSLA